MNLYRAFATVGGMTMISRILGFVRDIMIAAVLGTGPVADAFFVAFRLPNLFRRLFGEGAFNAAFVPIFAKRLEGDGKEAAARFAQEAMSGLLLVLLIFTAIAELAMPFIMYGFALGYSDTPEKFDLSIVLSRIMFPYLLCMSLVALLSGVLNALHRFWIASAAPIMLNVVLIAVMSGALLSGVGNSPAAGHVLAWGVFAAGLIQLGLLWNAARLNGVTLGMTRPVYNEDLKRLVRLGIPGVIASGIIQFNLVIGTNIASMQDGAVSFLYYADRIYQLPLGVVGVAIGVVLLPDVARHLRAGNHDAVEDSQNRALEFAAMLTLPAAVAISVVAWPIVRVLFERGAFTADDTTATAGALAIFAVGLPAFVLIKVFSPAYFAREDTKTPMRYAGVDMIVNVIASLALFFLFKSMGVRPHYGIAIATALAGWCNAVLLWRTLVRRGHYTADARVKKVLPKIALASAAMGTALWLGTMLVDPLFAADQPVWLRFSALAVLVAAGLAVYALLIQATGAARLGQIVGGLRRRSA
ncbi:MAG: murein biosynthesis integral membrane protein MurJ [Hyphomicrobiaceae bacterium]